MAVETVAVLQVILGQEILVDQAVVLSKLTQQRLVRLVKEMLAAVPLRVLTVVAAAAVKAVLAHLLFQLKAVMVAVE